LRIGSVVLLILALPAAAQETPASTPPAATEAAPVTLTLTEALKRALSDNTAVARARAEIAAAQAQERIFFSAILPRVGVNGTYTGNSEEAAFGSGDDRRVILPRTNWNYQLSLSQPIFAGNRERRALQQSRLGIDSARQGRAGRRGGRRSRRLGRLLRRSARGGADQGRRAEPGPHPPPPAAGPGSL
jgi:outer membrane protein TolC